MKTEFLKELGLTEEQIKSIMAENGKDVTKAKSDYEEIKAQLEIANTTIKDRDTQIEGLKKVDGEALQAEITKLQDENKTAKEKYEAELKDLQISNAIKLAISDKAQDADLVAGLFDKSKLILGEDGKVTGLKEQLKDLKENKGFLFKTEEPADPKPTPGFKVGGNGGNPNPQDGGDTPSIKGALTAMFAQQK